MTFACNKCVHDWCLREVDFIKLDTKDAIQNNTLTNTYLGESISNLSRDIISIVNWMIGEMFYKHGLRRYKSNSSKTSKNVYFFLMVQNQNVLQQVEKKFFREHTGIQKDGILD